MTHQIGFAINENNNIHKYIQYTHWGTYVYGLFGYFKRLVCSLFDAIHDYGQTLGGG